MQLLGECSFAAISRGAVIAVAVVCIAPQAVVVETPVLRVVAPCELVLDLAVEVPS